MKTVNVSESALETIKRMAVDREAEVKQLRDALFAVKKIASEQVCSNEWVTVESICIGALSS